MKKDIVIAVSIGFFLGSALAILLLNLPTIFKKQTATQVQNILPSITQVPPAAEKDAAFTITQPTDNQIQSEKTVALKGNYVAGKTILIETEKDTYAVLVDKDGKFSQKISLTEGVNEIYVGSYDENTEPKSQAITVFYTEEKL